jgi:prepilin-type processing-associated H-X9-DG protein
MHATARVVVATLAVLSINGASADGAGTGANSWIGYTGGGNAAVGVDSAVAAGKNNFASGQGSFVGAGTANQANGISSLVIGGFDNRAVAIDSLVGAGAGNRATGARSVIVGGGYNLASGQWSFVGGGGRDGTDSIPAGTLFKDNSALGDFSVIGGGQGNTAFADGSAVLGGKFNIAYAPYSAVAGGQSNFADADYAFVAGGQQNHAIGVASFVAGTKSVASSRGQFVWADNTQQFFDSTDSSHNQNGLWWANGTNTFSVRASGGVMFVTAVNGNGYPMTGIAAVAGSGSWASYSDRNVKENFATIDPRAILDHVTHLPITTWNYIAEGAAVRHLGPVAQDFRREFGLGHNDTTITVVDVEGVALAAIQGLHQLVQQKDDRIAALEAQARAQEERMAALQRSVEVLLERTEQSALVAHR